VTISESIRPARSRATAPDRLSPRKPNRMAGSETANQIASPVDGNVR
jgi:hypothetical protein